MSRLSKLAYPEATLTLDFGGSGTKGVVQIRGGTPSAIYMEPNAIAASRASLVEKTENNLCNAYPENVAWVGIASEYRAVGYLAASSYNATPGLRPRKYELALYKTLAAVWVIKQKFKLPSEFRLSLALLLPPGEFEDSSLLKPMLKEALAIYDTPTGQLQVNLTNYECFSEGCGIYMMYCKNKGADIKRQIMAIVMVGYRNASVLLSRRGILDKGRTSNLGMARLVELAMSRTAGQTPEELMKAIIKAGSDPKPQHFLKLVNSSDGAECTLRDRSIRDAQMEKIISAVKSARTEYAIALNSWLKEVLPLVELDEVIVCGGTTDYLREELNTAFGAIPVVWHGEVKVPVGCTVPTLSPEQLGNRYADVWALSVYHNAKMKAFAKEARLSETEVIVHG